MMMNGNGASHIPIAGNSSSGGSGGFATIIGGFASGGGGALPQHTAQDGGAGAKAPFCPFCGSRATTGNSDGTIGCSTCNNTYMVTVQPAHPGMPQQVDGTPAKFPGQPNPGDDLSSTDNPAALDSEKATDKNDQGGDPVTTDESEQGAKNKATDPKPPADKSTDDGSDKADDDKPKSKNLPPWLKGSKIAQMGSQSYLDHLAGQDNQNQTMIYLHRKNTKGALPGHIENPRIPGQSMCGRKLGQYIGTWRTTKKPDTVCSTCEKAWDSNSPKSWRG